MLTVLIVTRKISLSCSVTSMVPMPPFPIFHSLPHKAQVTFLYFPSIMIFSLSVTRSQFTPLVHAWHLLPSSLSWEGFKLALGTYGTAFAHVVSVLLYSSLQLSFVQAPFHVHANTLKPRRESSTDVQRPLRVPFLRGFHSFLVLFACWLPFFLSLYLKALWPGPLASFLSLAFLLHI